MRPKSGSNPWRVRWVRRAVAVKGRGVGIPGQDLAAQPSSSRIVSSSAANSSSSSPACRGRAGSGSSSRRSARRVGVVQPPGAQMRQPTPAAAPPGPPFAAGRGATGVAQPVAQLPAIVASARRGRRSWPSRSHQRRARAAARRSGVSSGGPTPPAATGNRRAVIGWPSTARSASAPWRCDQAVRVLARRQERRSAAIGRARSSGSARSAARTAARRPARVAVQADHRLVGQPPQRAQLLPR